LIVVKNFGNFGIFDKMYELVRKKNVENIVCKTEKDLFYMQGIL